MTPAIPNQLCAINHFALSQNIAESPPADSITMPPTGGNCLNWVVGHLVATRNDILEIVGKEPIWSDEKAAGYRRGETLTDADKALPWATLLEDFNSSQNTMLEGVGAMAPEALAAPDENPTPGKTVGETLFFYQFHEAYHIGQLGLLRRLVGKKGGIA